MKLLCQVAGAFAVSTLLAGCGSASGCSGVDMNTEYSANAMFIPSIVRLVNSNDSPRLVNLAVIRPDGSEGATRTVSVPAKGTAEERVDNLSRDYRVEIKSCQ